MGGGLTRGTTLILITFVHLCRSASQKRSVFTPRSIGKNMCETNFLRYLGSPYPSINSLFYKANLMIQTPNLTRTVEPCTSRDFYSAKWQVIFYLTENCVVLLSVKLRSKSVYKLHGIWLNKTSIIALNANTCIVITVVSMRKRTVNVLSKRLVEIDTNVCLVQVN